MNRKYCLDKKEWEEAQAALLLAKQFGLIEDALRRACGARV